MIKIRAKQYDNEFDIEFPAASSLLHAKLSETHALDGSGVKPVSVFLSEVYEPVELSLMANHSVHVDEMNFLARRMESLDCKEKLQMYEAAKRKLLFTPKDLINLTFNLDKFTLIQDISSPAAIGIAYTLNTWGAVPADCINDPKFALIGENLIESGKGIFTEHGLLFISDAPMQEVYDGQTFPDYYYRNDYRISVKIKHGERSELLLLPEDEFEIRKAAARIGAASDDDCSISIEVNNMPTEEWSDEISDILKDEGIYEANRLLNVLNTKDIDWDKLSAVVEFTGAVKASGIAALAKRLDDFEFISGVRSGYGIGRWFVENVSEYAIDSRMKEYFDYAGFGRRILEESGGEIVSNGFIKYNGSEELETLLCSSELENNEINMGGM